MSFVGVLLIGACIAGFFKYLLSGFDPQPAPVIHFPKKPEHYEPHHEHEHHEHRRELPRSAPVLHSNHDRRVPRA